MKRLLYVATPVDQLYLSHAPITSYVNVSIATSTVEATWKFAGPIGQVTSS